MSGYVSYADMDPEVYASLPHDNHSSDTIGAVALCMTLATIAVSLRLYTRYFVLNKFWVDDYLAIIGLMGAITNGVVQCVHTKYGLGAHMWDLHDTEYVQFFKMFYIMSITYNLSLMLIKFSFFFQYYRLIQEVPHYRIFYLSIMAAVTGWVVAQQFVLVFSCLPISFCYSTWFGESSVWYIREPHVKNANTTWLYSLDWDKSGPQGTCLDSNVIGWMNAIGNIVTDIIVLVLPIPVVWRLNLKKERKWAVIGIFGLGFFTCIVSICRMVFFAKLTTDVSYDLVAIAAWGEAESASGLICSSLIALGPLIRRFSKRLRTSKKTTSGTPRKYNIGTNPFSRHTTVRDKTLLRTNGSRKPFDDGSETELNRIDLERSRKGLQDDGRSIHSTKSSGVELSAAESGYSDPMPDLRLGLETGIRTIISSGNRDSMHSESPMQPNGIVVKQVWSVRNKEHGGTEE